MSRTHPDFEHEQKRLQTTIEYMKKMIELIVENRTKHREEMKQAMVDYDYLDSSQSYITILVNAQLLAYGEKNFDQFTRSLNKPYFARIDFKEDETTEFKRYYIGKLSLLTEEDKEPLIIDWRSPIASVYYEGRLGEVEYKTPTSKIRGELALKRQFVIENGELQSILDIDITTNDAFLQASLEASVDHRLKDIANSIQAEQNRVIRADIETPLIVQGVAGSGKTTIALHRIAYLIYTYEDRFIPENFVILAPNRLFINYISDALPELGAERIQQTTIADFMLELMGKPFSKYKLIPSEKKLLTLLERSEHTTEKRRNITWAAQFKGSLAFKHIIDQYLLRLENDMIPRVDFELDEHLIFDQNEVRRIFLEEYNFLPYQRRVDMVKKILSHKLKSIKPYILKKTTEDFNRRIDEIRYSTALEPEERRLKAIEMVESRDRALEGLKNKLKTLVKKYISLFPVLKPMEHYERIIGNPTRIRDLYRQAFQNDKTLANLSPDILSGEDTQREDFCLEESLHYLCTSSMELFTRHHLELEDLAPLAYIKHRLLGPDDKLEISHVFIDEAQDTSVFQIFALRHILNTKMFTLFGDVAQGIHAYRSIRDWKQVQEEVFPDIPCQFLTLEQSYRTTIEIMEHANHVIKEICSRDLVLAKPVIRHGKPPQKCTYPDVKNMVKEMEQIVSSWQNEGYQSIAIIGKTLEECKLLQKHLCMQVNILQGDETVYEGQVLLVPAYVAKGLEFDTVIIFSLLEEYTKDDLDLKLLYVAMTRARQQLTIMGVDSSM